jgi:hypothetical protein
MAADPVFSVVARTAFPAIRRGEGFPASGFGENRISYLFNVED